MKVSLLYHFNALMKAERIHRREMAKELRRALSAALASNDKRLVGLNELRGDVATKGDLQVALSKIAELVSRVDRSEGRGRGLSAAWQILLGVAAIVSVGIAAIAFIMSR